MTTQTTAQATTLTAKHFQDPLLRVLGDLSGLTAGVPVKGEDTYQPVMTLMGIPSIDHLGVEPSSGQPLVQRNIQWACKNLRKTGHVDLQGRGLWTLTPAGVAEAQKLAGVTVAGPTPAPTPQVVSSIPAPTPQAAPQRAPVMSRGHLDDPYILGLILSQTGCLGHYTSHQGAECTTCCVVPECKAKQYAGFSQIAARLALKDKLATMTPNTAPAALKAPASTAPADPKVPRPRPRSTLDLSNATEINAFEQTVCSECGEVIPKGAKCWWVEDTKTEVSILVHIECPEAP